MSVLKRVGGSETGKMEKAVGMSGAPVAVMAGSDIDAKAMRRAHEQLEQLG